MFSPADSEIWKLPYISVKKAFNLSWQGIKVSIDTTIINDVVRNANLSATLLASPKEVVGSDLVGVHQELNLIDNVFNSPRAWP